jgi:hypothetical protein
MYENFKSVVYMHYFNHTINNRQKILFTIYTFNNTILLLPPRSRINKCQIATNYNTNRPPRKLVIGLREDESRMTRK